MKYLHTMVRISNIEDSLQFYCQGLGLQEVRRSDYDSGRFTLIFLASPEDLKKTKNPPMIELTYNWDPETYLGGRNFGHLAFSVDHIYDTCSRLEAMGITILRPPRDGRMAFIKSPDGISIELLQSGDALPPAPPWSTRQNSGSW
ncbi:MAG: VOC family protein [Candidatus Margulisiibacteriota bacterium]